MLLGQHHTEEILRAHIAKYGIHVELGTELVGFEQDEDGVTVHLRKTALGQDTTEAEDFRTPFLIAGDGAKSTHFRADMR